MGALSKQLARLIWSLPWLLPDVRACSYLPLICSMWNSVVCGGNSRRGVEVLWGVGGQIFVGWGIEVVGGWWKGSFMSHSNTLWGNDPTSAEALFSILAFVVALIALIYTGLLHRIERTRHHSELGDRASYQAERLACWPRPDVEALGDDQDIQDYAFAGVSAQIQNRSLQPVYNFSIKFMYQDEIVHRSQVPVVPPGDSYLENIPQEVLNMVSTVSKDFDIPMNIYEANRLAKYETSRFVVSYSFTDSKQMQWNRDFNGKLENIKS